jgi:hypothetical protein
MNCGLFSIELAEVMGRHAPVPAVRPAKKKKPAKTGSWLLDVINAWCCAAVHH